ncbi:MAG TPA: hypothetical protein VGA53_03440 [Candidatus Paceibacterota bacterium]
MRTRTVSRENLLGASFHFGFPIEVGVKQNGVILETIKVYHQGEVEELLAKFPDETGKFRLARPKVIEFGPLRS